MKIKVELKSGEFKTHTLPFGLRQSEIIGWLDDKYGDDWVDYDEIC